MNTVVVGIADLKVAEPPRKLVTYGLGSCVAIVLHSREDVVGAMAHIMLPLAFNEDDGGTPGKFADTAVGGMVQQLKIRGLEPGRFVAKLAGGADMFANRFMGTGRRIGARNVLAARKTLDHFGIPLVAEDVGGNAGRSVEFSIESGLLTVRTLRGALKKI